MRMPRISVQTLMALAMVVAVDGMAFRAIATRPEGMTGYINWFLLNTLPMSHLLAVSVAFWIRGRRTVGSFWSGFTTFGHVALVASNVALEPILDWWEKVLTATWLEAWADQSPAHERIALNGIVPALLMFPQVIVASMGGGLTRLIPGRPAGPGDVASPRRRLAALIATVALVAIPSLGAEVDLDWEIDRKYSRLTSGSEAIVVLDGFRPIQAVLANSTGPVFLGGPTPSVPVGTRVRVARDDGPMTILAVQLIRNGETTTGDFRDVQVTLLGVESSGKSIRIPRCALRRRPSTSREW